MYSTSCDEAGAHYNPTYNYGEISGKYGFIPKAGINLNTPSVSLEGPYSFAGRSMVLHNSTGYRTGCCQVEIVSDTITEATPYATPNLLCRIKIPNINLTLTTGNVAIEATAGSYTGWTVESFVDSGCLTPYPTGINVTLGAAASFATTVNVRLLAGKSLKVNGGGLLNGCCVVIEQSFQMNLNSVYYSSQGSSNAASSSAVASSKPATTGGAECVLISLMFVLLALIF